VNTGSETPYYSLNSYLRTRFGEKVVRVPISLHRDCPNRLDGRIGCLFCLPESYEPDPSEMAGSITVQLDRGIARLGRHYHAHKFIAYLQSGSNTHGPPDELECAYTEALAHDGIVALSISTRPDCLSEEILEVIAMLAEQHEIWVELGVQSAHDATLDTLNRHHDAACSFNAITALQHAGIAHIALHMIIGLPGESEADMHESFRRFTQAGCPRAQAHSEETSDIALRVRSSRQPTLGLKLHHLQVIEGTPLEQQWRAGAIATFDLDDYARVVVDILEHVPADVVIHRLFGSAPERYLCAPVWPGSKAEQQQRILTEFAARGTWQGKQVSSDQ
jgi:radical SAM protein (TIGR01212 family)